MDTRGYARFMPTRAVSSIEVEGRRLEVSNLDKVLFPADGFTKGEMIRYYAAIAPVLVPHLRNRPVTLKRYPDGIEGEAFYEKRCPRHRPRWMPTVTVPSKRSGTITYCTVNDTAALLWLANLGAIELHPLLGRDPRVDEPTSIVFDLDPGAPADIFSAGDVALEVRDLLARAGLSPLVKVSGSKGLHVAAPMNGTSFNETKEFAHALATALEKRQPLRIVSSMRKELRSGKVLIDWSQNDATKTTVAVYSLRARSGPTVSAPITWSELEHALEDRDPTKLRFRPEEVLERVRHAGDLFAPLIPEGSDAGPSKYDENDEMERIWPVQSGPDH